MIRTYMAMAPRVRDPEIDRFAGELTDLRPSTKTAKVKAALLRKKENLPLGERIEPIQDRLAAYSDSGLATDKAFNDDFSGEDER